MGDGAKRTRIIWSSGSLVIWSLECRVFESREEFQDAAQPSCRSHSCLEPASRNVWVPFAGNHQQFQTVVERELLDRDVLSPEPWRASQQYNKSKKFFHTSPFLKTSSIATNYRVQLSVKGSTVVSVAQPYWRPFPLHSFRQCNKAATRGRNTFSPLRSA